MLVLINTIREELTSRTVHLHMGLFPHYSFTAGRQTCGPFLMDFLRDKQGSLGFEPCFLQFRGNFLLTSRSWLEISTNIDWENRPMIPIGMSAPETGNIETQPSLGIWLHWLYREHEEFGFGAWFGVPVVFPAESWRKLVTPVFVIQSAAEMHWTAGKRIC